MCGNCGFVYPNTVYAMGPNQIIKGCCVVQEGFYCIWDMNHMTLVCEEWAELCDLYNVIRQVSHITFNVVAERQRARTALNNLRRDAPFGECQRFPWRKTYVNLSCSVYGNLFQTLLGALDFKDRETEKELRYGKDKKQDDKDQTSSSNSSIDDSKTAFRNALKNITNELCKKNEVFDRIKFETKYGLTWCLGPCPTEPGVTNPPVIPPPGGNPGGGNPPPTTPPPTTPPVRRTYGDIMEELKSRGLDAEDFNVFSEADMRTGSFDCGKTPQKLGPTLADKFIPATVQNVYVFTSGEYAKCGRDVTNPSKGFIFGTVSGKLSQEMALYPPARVVDLEFEKFLGSIDLPSLITKLYEKSKDEGEDPEIGHSRWSNSRLRSRSRASAEAELPDPVDFTMD